MVHIFPLQLLLDNTSRSAPNITHLLLKFDLDAPVERTVLQPKFHYRFWLVISWQRIFFCFCSLLLHSDSDLFYFLFAPSCLKVILDILDKLSKPDVNALLHEFGFQVMTLPNNYPIGLNDLLLILVKLNLFLHAAPLWTMLGSCNVWSYYGFVE